MIRRTWYKRIADAIHQGGTTYACFHSDGYIMDIVPDLIEVGWDEINPQVALMDMDELARRYGGKVCFRPCPDSQGVIPNGTPDEVRAHLEHIFDTLGHFNGGFVASGWVTGDVPLANIEAMMETLSSMRYAAP